MIVLYAKFTCGAWVQNLNWIARGNILVLIRNQVEPGFLFPIAEYESMMHRTGVKSVIFRKLFPLIERIGHRFRRRVPAMLNEGVKHRIIENG